MYAGVPTQVPVLVSVASACLPLESRSVSVPSCEMTSPVSPASSSSPAPAWRAMPKSTTRGRLLLVEEDVVRLEVAVDQPGRVRGGQAPAGGDEDVEDLAPRARLLREPALDRPTGDELHRQEHLVVDDADVVNGDDVRVLEARDRLCFTQQARPRRVLHALPGLDQLEGDLSIELRIIRAVDDAHRAGADALDDHVTPDPGARVELAGCHARGSCVGATVLHVFPLQMPGRKAPFVALQTEDRFDIPFSLPPGAPFSTQRRCADGRISGTIQQQA